jgi:hypothetical protein
VLRSIIRLYQLSYLPHLTNQNGESWPRLRYLRTGWDYANVANMHHAHLLFPCCGGKIAASSPSKSLDGKAITGIKNHCCFFVAFPGLVSHGFRVGFSLSPFLTTGFGFHKRTVFRIIYSLVSCFPYYRCDCWMDYRRRRTETAGLRALTKERWLADSEIYLSNSMNVFPALRKHE